MHITKKNCVWISKNLHQRKPFNSILHECFEIIFVSTKLNPLLLPYYQGFKLHIYIYILGCLALSHILTDVFEKCLLCIFVFSFGVFYFCVSNLLIFSSAVINLPFIPSGLFSGPYTLVGVFFFFF